MAIREALLALLKSEPKFGLQLKTEFEIYTGEVWPLNVGQVYSTLSRLDRDGFVEVRGDVETEAGQKTYSLTALGESELTTWLMTPNTPAHPPRDELVIKILVALTLDGADIPLILQAHRKPLIESMRHATKIKATSNNTSALLAADAEIFRLEASVRWLDSVETRLRAGGSLDLPTAPDDMVNPKEEASPRKSDLEVEQATNEKASS